jgi:hypothetical protein
MIDITFNIGYRGELGSGTLNIFPIYFPVESFKEFSNYIRNNAFEWSLFAHDENVPKSHLCFYVSIYEKDIKSNVDDDWWYWNFIIHVKNIREFKPILNLTRDEVDEMRLQREREEKLNEILNLK